MTVKETQLLEDFDKTFRENFTAIKMGVVDSYSRFPRKDAKELSHNVLKQFFIEKSFIIPWNIFILDEKQEFDACGYAYGRQDTELVFLFKITEKSLIQVSLDLRTQEQFIEYKVKTIKNEWLPIIDNYQCLGFEALPEKQEVNCINEPIEDGFIARLY